MRRHLTVLVVTRSTLVITHADDPRRARARASGRHRDERDRPAARRARRLLTHVVASPDDYVGGRLGRELTLTIGWGAVSRLDLVPATCGDRSATPDHGFEGTVASVDISLRISAAAEGDDALAEALDFAARAVPPPSAARSPAAR